MKPAVVFPMNDLSGVMFGHLRVIASTLADLFQAAYVSVTPAASAAQSECVNRMEKQAFFQVVHLPDDLPIGAHFAGLYQAAAAAAPAEQVLHLCFIDRLSFAIQSEYRAAFITDIQALKPQGTPLIYLRSEAAWATHPRNYLEIEGMVTRVGELLFGSRLDYAWCHIAVFAADLRESLKQVRRNDLAMVAEVVLGLGEKCRTREVDWLAWEDPFILEADAVDLRRARESSKQETLKRIGYAIPMLQALEAVAINGKSWPD